MRISDWSSDVCSSDLGERIVREYLGEASRGKIVRHRQPKQLRNADPAERRNPHRLTRIGVECPFGQQIGPVGEANGIGLRPKPIRSEEHTSELQSLMRISYAVVCLKQKMNAQTDNHNTIYY